MNAKDRALDQASNSADPKLRKWAEDQREKAAKANPPELSQRPPGEAPASAVLPREPEAKPVPAPKEKRQGNIGNCHDCGNPIDKRKDWQPFHSTLREGEIIIHTCLACANIRWKAANGFTQRTGDLSRD